MQVLMINNDGGGFADYVEVEPNTTIVTFFEQQMPGRAPADFMIRVNREHVARDHVLKDGDRISATPTKIEGADVA